MVRIWPKNFGLAAVSENLMPATIRSIRQLAAVAFACGIVAIRGWAADLPIDQVEFFEKRIRPVLVEHCYKCHSEKGVKGIQGGLSLESREGLRKGGATPDSIGPSSIDGFFRFPVSAFRFSSSPSTAFLTSHEDLPL
jgi:hypothetical protein